MAPKAKAKTPNVNQTIATAKKNLAMLSGTGNSKAAKPKVVKASKPKLPAQSQNLKRQAAKATGSSMW